MTNKLIYGENAVSVEDSKAAVKAVEPVLRKIMEGFGYTSARKTGKLFCPTCGSSVTEEAHFQDRTSFKTLQHDNNGCPDYYYIKSMKREVLEKRIEMSMKLWTTDKTL